MPKASKAISHHIKVATIEFMDGKTLPLSENAIVIITGSNNAGKSTLLDEVQQFFKKYGRNSYRPKVIREIKKGYMGPAEGVFDYLAERFSTDPDDPDTLKLQYSHRYKRDPIEKRWAEGNVHEIIEEQFLAEIGLNTRVGYGHGGVDPVEKAADEMFYDESKELLISRIFKRAFGKDIILQRERAGGVFKIGSRVRIPKHKDRLKPEYKKELDQLENVFKQGTGMRSFARMAISLLTSWRSVIVIDEPELFLHPPQAKQLARLIASDVEVDRQFFLATHNETFLRNILDFGRDRVVVLRLDRKRTTTHVNVLDNEAIAEFWNDPLLRTSNIISSLFHDAVVITEGESDVRFFEALMDAVYGQENLPDTAFFSCNGKGKIPSILAAVTRAKIPATVVTDFDVLRSKAETLKVFELLGGDINDIDKDLDVLHHEIMQDAYAPKLKTIKSKLLEAIEEENEDKPLSSATISKMRRIVEHGSPWSQLKLSGVSTIKSQKGYNAAKRILSKCLEVGFIINEFGELESLCRDVDSESKSGWLHEVLTKELRVDPSLDNARALALALKAKLPKIRS